jgi:hypothetical protein
MTALQQSTNFIVLEGKMSTFGGPEDHGVEPDENLALCDCLSDNYNFGVSSNIAALFLKAQPYGTTGTARRLDTTKYYIACRWDYTKTPKEYLIRIQVTVKNLRNGKSLLAQPIDWGPNENTGRIADMSPGLSFALGLYTDDICQVKIRLP